MTFKNRRSAAVTDDFWHRCAFMLVAITGGGCFALWLAYAPTSNTDDTNYKLLAAQLLIDADANTNATVTEQYNVIFNENPLESDKRWQEQQQNQGLQNGFRAADANFDGLLAVDDQSLAAGVHRNGFDNKLNSSNQRNDLNGRDAAAATTAELKGVPYQPTAAKENGVVSSAPTLSPPISSSYFEYVERLEAGLNTNATPNHYAWQEQQQQRSKLLLHRQKRYLVFPEGSSFQLVFDLIIPIVDYTNFAIMGITCAVAWELPSKPPSEVLDNFREKLNEGTYGLSRRNDTVSVANNTRSSVNSLKYMAEGQSATNGDGGDAGLNSVALPTPNLKYGNAAPVGEPPRRASLTLPAPAARPASTYYYYAKPELPSATASTLSGNAYQNDDASRRYMNGGTANNNLGTQPSYNPPMPHDVTGSGISSASGYANSAGSDRGSDKQNRFSAAATAADWWQPHSNNKWQTWQDHKGDWQPQLQQQQWQRQQQPTAAFTYAGGAAADNWWQRNKQRVQSDWRTKQQHWQKYEQREQPTDGVASSSNAGHPRSHTQSRPPLSTRPKHRIYNVFGRRRRQATAPPAGAVPPSQDPFELRLHAIHMREQLRSRQKLYLKIEKFFQANGKNGKACVLRALCETGQRRRQHRLQRATAPQSFITELLRAIFTLPDTKALAGQSESSLMRWQRAAVRSNVNVKYRKAFEHDGDCMLPYATCEHSIWD